MNDKELDLLLAESLGSAAEPPPYLDTRLRGELALARKTPRGFSLWWLPLALSTAMGLVMFLSGALMPWPVDLLLQLSAVLTVLTTAAFTLVGLFCFDLREKGRVALWQT